MRLSRLKLNHFRVYQEIDLNFAGDLIFFIGANGSGKTSLLEAIHHLSILRSFRKGKDSDLVCWQNPFYAIQGTVINEKGSSILHAGYSQEKNAERHLLIDKIKVKRVSDFIGRLQLVVFTPDDMTFVDTAVAERRRFFDMLLSSLFPSYFEALQKYKRAMEQRSSLLKSSKSFDPLFFKAIDQELATAGFEIMQKRGEFLRQFAEPFSHYVSMISAQNDTWEIFYQPSYQAAQSSEQGKHLASREGYLQALRQNLSKDIRTKQTTMGIHRDKIFFRHKKTQKDIQMAASQGQKRTVALALRMAQFDLARHYSHETPLVLIDDVLNELDLARRARFIGFLKQIGQAFITTTDLSGMEDFIEEQKKKMKIEIFQVEHGKAQLVSE